MTKTSAKTHDEKVVSVADDKLTTTYTKANSTVTRWLRTPR